LGGPGTFAAQAAAAFASESEIAWFASAREEWQALTSGAIDAFVMNEEASQTGFGDLAARAASPGAGFFVAAEVQVPYRCALLAKPGTRLVDVRTVLGHGSVQQCQPFFDQYLPDVQISMERTNSLDAARKVVAADGSWSGQFTIPSGAVPGLAQLNGQCFDASHAVQTTVDYVPENFLVEQSTMQASPTSGPVGTIVGLSPTTCPPPPGTPLSP